MLLGAERVNLAAANRLLKEILPRHSILSGCKQTVLSIVNAFAVFKSSPPVMLHTLLFEHA